MKFVGDYKNASRTTEVIKEDGVDIRSFHRHALEL